jgi:catechol 2,3-dioxygenase-like lactoylglutathione lyase family enzyme
VVAAGAKAVLSPRIAPDGRTLFAFIADPDGNLIELLQRSVAA